MTTAADPVEATEESLVVLFHTTMADVAKGAIDRARDSAKYVQTAAAAVNALYVAVLGLVFSVTNHPLPARGVYPTLFLAAAVALSTAYLAFLTSPKAPEMWSFGASETENQFARTMWLVRWVNSVILDRRYAIRSSVLALGLGVLLIPGPFVSLGRAPSLPPAPTAPTIPGEIAPSVEADAVKLFAAQVSDFTTVTEARKDAVEQAKTASDREWMLELGFGVVALVGAGVVGLGPGLWAWRRKEGRHAAKPVTKAAPAKPAGSGR